MKKRIALFLALTGISLFSSPALAGCPQTVTYQEDDGNGALRTKTLDISGELRDFGGVAGALAHEKEVYDANIGCTATYPSCRNFVAIALAISAAVRACASSEAVDPPEIRAQKNAEKRIGSITDSGSDDFLAGGAAPKKKMKINKFVQNDIKSLDMESIQSLWKKLGCGTSTDTDTCDELLKRNNELISQESAKLKKLNESSKRDEILLQTNDNLEKEKNCASQPGSVTCKALAEQRKSLDASTGSQQAKSRDARPKTPSGNDECDNWNKEKRAPCISVVAEQPHVMGNTTAYSLLVSNSCQIRAYVSAEAVGRGDRPGTYIGPNEQNSPIVCEYIQGAKHSCTGLANPEVSQIHCAH